MRVVDAEVDWREDVANPPRLRILVDETPDRSEMRFEHDNGLWYGEHEGYVEFFSWSGNGNDGGFSGRHYRVTTVDGEEVTLKGPWSSRAGAVNRAGFGPCVGVRLTTSPEVMEKGYTFRSGAVTLETAKQAVDIAEGASHLERRIRFGDEPYWIPVRGEEA